MKIKIISLCSILLCMFFSCDSSVVTHYPPFVISSFVIKTESEQKTLRTAEFLFKNASDKDVAEVNVNFRLYYSDGSFPTSGNNRIVVAWTGIIPSKSEKMVTVPLDKYIQIYKDSRLIADQILVEKIIYRDGSVWTDPLGFWQMGGIQ